MREMKALIWKEWRDQWGTIGMMAIVAILLPHVPWEKGFFRYCAPGLTFYTWILFALVLAAGLFTSDTTTRHSEFLTLLPLGKWKPWSVKIILGLSCVAALTLLSLEAVNREFAAKGLHPPDVESINWYYRWFEVTPEPGLHPGAGRMIFALLLPVTAFLLASVISSLATRGLEAFFGSLVACPVCGLVYLAAKKALCQTLSSCEYRLSGFSGITEFDLLMYLSVVLGFGSYLAFPLQARSAFRRLLGACLGMLSVLVATVLALACIPLVTDQIPSLCAVRLQVAVQPGGQLVAVSASSRWWRSRIWLVKTDGSGTRKVARGCSTFGAPFPSSPWSADGRYFAYVTYSGNGIPFFYNTKQEGVLYDSIARCAHTLPLGSPMDSAGDLGIGFLGSRDRPLLFCDGRSGRAWFIPDRGLTLRLRGLHESSWVEIEEGNGDPQRLLNLFTNRVLDLGELYQAFRRPPPAGNPVRVLEVSASGAWVVFELCRDQTPSRKDTSSFPGRDIFVWSTADRKATCLTPVPIAAQKPAVSHDFDRALISPDEKFLALWFCEIPERESKNPDERRRVPCFSLWDLTSERTISLPGVNDRSWLDATFSFDSRWLVYGGGQDWPRWHLVDLQTGKEAGLSEPRPADAWQAPDTGFCIPTFSPSNRWLVYWPVVVEKQPRCVPMLRDLHTGEETIVSNEGSGDITWSPDETRIAYVTFPELQLSRLNVFDLAQKDRKQCPLGFKAVMPALWLDSGRILLLSEGSYPPPGRDIARFISLWSGGAYQGSAIWVVNADGTNLKRIFP